MTVFGRITKVGDLKEVAAGNQSASTQYQQPLKVRGLEVKWFGPRNSQMGTRAGVTGVGVELRNELAVTFSLQVGDWICLEYDTYPNTYTDQKGCLTCATRLIVNRYAPICNFDELM